MNPMTSKTFLQKFEGASVVFFAQNAHIAQIRRRLHGCYLNISLPAEVAAELATRDTMRLWRQLIAEQARLFNANAKKLRVFYIPSRRPGTFWLLNQKDPDLTGPIRCPLGQASDLLTTGENNNDTHLYMHNHITSIDDVNVAAFLGAGHGVINGLEAMLGVRIDDYPASKCAPCKYVGAGNRDALHMCLPGAPDYAVDVVLRQAFGPSLKRPVPVGSGQNVLAPDCLAQTWNRSRSEPLSVAGVAAQQLTNPSLREREGVIRQDWMVLVPDTHF